MNSAYWSSCVFTDSSTLAWIVTDFGCFGGALMIAMLCFSSSYLVCLTLCITTCILRLLHAAKTRSPFFGDGRERSHELFGRLKAAKVGSLPPNLVFFSASLFSFSSRSFPGFPETYGHHNVKKLEKTNLK